MLFLPVRLQSILDTNLFKHTELLLDAEQSMELLINSEGLRIPEELLSHAKVFVVFLNLYKASDASRGKVVLLFHSPKAGR